MSRVLVIGDTHAPCLRKGYIEHCARVRDAWQTDTVVHIGDVVDWTAISFHDNDPRSPSAGEEIDLARPQVHAIYSEFSEAVILTGNHDSLPARRMVAMGVPVELLREPDEFWETPGWNYVERFGVHEIDEVLYKHGDSGKGGMHSAYKNAKENFCSMVQGHMHSQASVEYYANERAKVFGMQVGCGADHHKLQMQYGRKYNAKPLISCGVVIDGEHATLEMMTL